MEMRELLTEMGYDGENIPMIKGSALSALEGKQPEIGSAAIAKLLDAIDQHIPDPVRELDKPFLMPVEGTHSIPGRGTVVTGKLDRGKIKKGMECEFIGYTKSFKSTITGIEMFHQTLEEAHAGDQLGALIKGTKREDIRRGMIMCKPGSMKAHDNFEAQAYILLEKEGGRKKPIINYMQLVLYSKTWDCPVQVLMKDKSMVMPGEDAG